jgi:hypothetical protein
MPYNPFGDLTIHLTESTIPSPLKLASLVEATFPGYVPSPISQSQFSRIDSGLSALKCTGNFVNDGITGSARPTGAFLVRGSGTGAELVSFVVLARSSYPPINHGQFFINLNFVFSSTD